MKRPELIPDWKRVLRRAWSIRLMLLAGLLSGVEVILPIITDALPWPRWASASLVAVVVSGAFVSRLLAQKDEE